MKTPPVGLVHGFLSDHRLMAPMAHSLRRRGIDPHLTPLAPLCVQDVRELADQLMAQVRRIQDATGAEQVDLVGASQGGIIATYAAANLDRWTNIRRVVTVSSPFLGSHMASVFSPLLGPVAPGIRQLRPGSSLLTALRQAPIPKGALHTLGIRGDFVVPPSRSQHPAAAHRTVRPCLTPIQHQYMMVSPAVSDAIVERLSA